jgi:hypothetical protein
MRLLLLHDYTEAIPIAFLGLAVRHSQLMEVATVLALTVTWAISLPAITSPTLPVSTKTMTSGMVSPRLAMRHEDRQKKHLELVVPEQCMTTSIIGDAVEVMDMERLMHPDINHSPRNINQSMSIKGIHSLRVRCKFSFPYISLCICNSQWHLLVDHLALTTSIFNMTPGFELEINCSCTVYFVQICTGQKIKTSCTDFVYSIMLYTIYKYKLLPPSSNIVLSVCCSAAVRYTTHLTKKKNNIYAPTSLLISCLAS